MNITGFFPSSPLAWGRNWEWPLRHSLSHAVIVFTSAVARLIITNSPTNKAKKKKKSLSFCPHFLHSSCGRRYFKQATGKRKLLVLLSFAPEQKEAAEKERSLEEPSRWPCLNLVKFAQGTMKHLHLLFSSSVGTDLAEPWPNLLLHN